MENKDKYYTIITCGTAGHVFPAIEIAKSLIKKEKFFSFIIDNKSYKKFKKIIEENLIFKYCKIIITYSFFLNYFLLISFFQNIFVSFSSIKKSNVILTFTCGIQIPILFLSVLLRKKIILHEQDSILNKTNKLFAKYATYIFTSFQEVKNTSLEKTKWIGCPISKNIKKNYSKNIFIDKKKITILGGTNGSDFFDKVLPQYLITIFEIKYYTIYHNCRKENLEFLKKFYEENKIKANVSVFFENFEKIIYDSSLLITRAGASTLSYLNIYNKNCIIIPWEESSQNHQVLNGINLKKIGCIVIKEKKIKIILYYIKSIILSGSLFQRNNIHKVFKCINPDDYLLEIDNLFIKK